MTNATLLFAAAGVVSCVGQAQNEHAVYVVLGRKHLTLKQIVPLLPNDVGVNVLRQVLFALCCVCMGADWSPRVPVPEQLLGANEDGRIFFLPLIPLEPTPARHKNEQRDMLWLQLSGEGRCHRPVAAEVGS